MVYIARVAGGGGFSSSESCFGLLCTICHVYELSSHDLISPSFRSGLIFYRKGLRKVDKKGNKIMYDLGPRIDQALFPGLQGMQINE